MINEKVNMLQLPTLSVVFPNYNHTRFLPEQLNSMLSQSYRPKEIIIIDDASTDNSVEVINEFIRKEPRIRLICNERNMGVEWNINRLIEIASGDYVYLSASDDMVLPGFFEKTMALLALYPEAGLCSAIGRLIDEHGNDRGIRALPVISNKPSYFSPAQVQQKLCRYGRWFAISSMIIKREALVREGGQVTELGSFADNFAALVIALRHGACFIPEPFSCWRQMATGHGTLSGKNWEVLSERGKSISRMMRTRYRDLFPTKYTDQFEKHWKYRVSITAWNQAHLEKEQILTGAFNGLCDKRSFLGHAFWSMLRVLTQIQAITWRLYFLLKYGQWSWWLMGRLSIVINLKKLVIKERLEIQCDNEIVSW